MGSTPSLKVVAKQLTSRRETDDHGIGPGDGSPLPGQPVQTLCGTRIPPERCSGLITARATWRGSSVHRRSNMWLNPWPGWSSIRLKRFPVRCRVVPARSVSWRPLFTNPSS